MSLRNVFVFVWGLMIAFLFTGCVGVPKGVQPVQGFALDRYMGRWYEIARLDHSFERGLSHVTAEYSMRKDGGVRVLNRGYSENNKEWKSAEGKAYFVKSPDQGYLKVSFFGPFYGSYVVFELEAAGRNVLPNSTESKSNQPALPIIAAPGSDRAPASRITSWASLIGPPRTEARACRACGAQVILVSEERLSSLIG
jgi:lipocalin